MFTGCIDLLGRGRLVGYSHQHTTRSVCVSVCVCIRVPVSAILLLTVVKSSKQSRAVSVASVHLFHWATRDL